MESENIYEESREELNKISKLLSTDTVTINLSKLDRKTKLDFIETLNNLIIDRRHAIENVILGVH